MEQWIIIIKNHISYLIENIKELKSFLSKGFEFFYIFLILIFLKEKYTNFLIIFKLFFYTISLRLKFKSCLYSHLLHLLY